MIRDRRGMGSRTLLAHRPPQPAALAPPGVSTPLREITQMHWEVAPSVSKMSCIAHSGVAGADEVCEG